MADPAETDARNAGNPTDEEERPDLGMIETMLAAAGPLLLEFVRDGDNEVIYNDDTGLEVFWRAPDMEGHPNSIALGELLAGAPAFLVAMIAEVRRLRSLAGVTE